MIQRVTGQLPGAAPGQGKKIQNAPKPQSGFGALLQQELAKQQPARAEERGIQVTPHLMDQLAGSVARAQAKGAANILAMDADKAFIINVPSAKVITAITQDEMKENIFTNIDGAVFL